MTDLAFADNPLLVFQRTYLSSRHEDVGLGRGWSFVFNDSITLNGDNAVLTSSAGDNFAYNRDGAQHFSLQTAETTDIKEFIVESADTISAKNGDAVKTFSRSGNKFHLTRIVVSAGMEIMINRSANGQVQNISSLSGQINFNWSNDGNNANLLSVEDNTGRRVSFGQSNNLLRGVITVTGGEWKYQYVNGRLTLAVDPANRVALGANYDAMGRTVDFGDAVNIRRLSYNMSAAGISMRTSVTDSLNYERVFEHNDRGFFTGAYDAQGVLAKIGYDAADRPVQITDASGATQTFNYNAEQQIAREQTPNGEKVFEYYQNGKIAAVSENGNRAEYNYDNNGNLLESRARKNGKIILTNYNRGGKITHMGVENGLSMNFEYDNKGRETAFIHSKTGRFETAYDDAGRKTAERLPSGLTYLYEYNADNKLTRKKDNRGNGFRTEYDASGALTKLVKDDGSWSQIIRDDAGRIIEMKNSRGKSRRYAYNARGALIEYVGADGRYFQFQYDARGRLQNIVKARASRQFNNQEKPENIFGMRKSYQFDSFEIKNVSYMASSADSNFELLSANSTQDGCLFGGDSFWFVEPGTDLTYEIILPEDQFNPCFDPFAGMWGYEDWGLGGAELTKPETCEECQIRQKKICDAIRSACLWDRGLTRTGGGIVVGGGTGAAVGTVFPAIGNVAGGVIGGLIGAVGGATSAILSCNSERDACYLSVLNNDKCGSICNQ